MGLRQDPIGRLKQAIFPYELRIAVLRCQRTLGESCIIAIAITSEILLVDFGRQRAYNESLIKRFQSSNTSTRSVSNSSERLDLARSGGCCN